MERGTDFVESVVKVETKNLVKEMSRGQGHGHGKSFISDQQIKSDSIKSKRRQDGWPYFCTTTNICSGNNSNAKTLIEYDIDETIDIKEEIVQDEEGHQWEKHNLRSDRNQLDEKCVANEISSINNSGAKALIEYDYDETLKIKKETIQDQENIGQRPKPEKKYKCENCARSYTHKSPLNRHKKFECDVMPQFNCKFCGTQFTHKSNMNRHILRMHQKTNSKASQARLNCNKCSRSYSSTDTLGRHKRLKHATVSLQNENQSLLAKAH